MILSLLVRLFRFMVSLSSAVMRRSPIPLPTVCSNSLSASLQSRLRHLLVLTGLSGDRPLPRRAEGELLTLPAQLPALLPGGERGKPSQQAPRLLCVCVFS